MVVEYWFFFVQGVEGALPLVVVLFRAWLVGTDGVIESLLGVLLQSLQVLPYVDMYCHQVKGDCEVELLKKAELKIRQSRSPSLVTDEQ